MKRMVLLRRLSGATLIVAALIPATAISGDSYEYDPAGRLSRVTYYTGRIVDYAYDDNSNITAIISSLATAVDPSPDAPALVDALRVSEPNPASREALLRFSLARGGKTTLRFFDVTGRLVQTITDREYPPGRYEARVSLSRWPAGVYFYRLDAPGFRATRKLVVLR